MSLAVLSHAGPAALPAAGAGLFAAGHAASWGAFKDIPFEGFRLRSYLRTLVLGAVIAVLLTTVLPVSSAASVAVLVGATYALERLATEWWKSIVRNDDQAAYTIPMRLGLFGRPVEKRQIRYLVGAAVVAVVASGLLGLHVAQQDLAATPWWVAVPLVGSLGGWATAVGGAWKDAPIEGFSFMKFLRSPAVATAWALPLAAMTPSWPALMLASAGYAVVSIETYKTFFTRGRPPGKFAGKPVRVLLPRLRATLAAQNAAWWAVLAGVLAIAISAPTLAGLGGVVTRSLAAVTAVGAVVVSAALTRGRRLPDQHERPDLMIPSSGASYGRGMRCVVVIPTYNEALTITDTLNGLVEAGRVSDCAIDVLVVDDNSPDGTGGLVRAHRDFGHRVWLLTRRSKDGLGAAYRAGFAAALDAGYDVIVQMDADGSHPVSAIPPMLEMLADHDVVIGSRYVEGGATGNWPLRRRALSQAANAYARGVLGLRTHDVTAGFRAWRAEAVRRAGVLVTTTDGYGFQVENTWHAERAGLRIGEHPITFVDRTAGASKMTAAVAREALLRVLQWRLGELVHADGKQSTPDRAPQGVL